MELKFTVVGRIAKPVEDVFEAAVSPDRLSKYFTTGGAKGRLETGAKAPETFTTFPVPFPSWCRKSSSTERSCCKKIVLQ